MKTQIFKGLKLERPRTRHPLQTAVLLLLSSFMGDTITKVLYEVTEFHANFQAGPAQDIDKRIQALKKKKSEECTVHKGKTGNYFIWEEEVEVTGFINAGDRNQSKLMLIRYHYFCYDYHTRTWDNVRFVDSDTPTLQSGIKGVETNVQVTDSSFFNFLL
ncbi:uncharacterized protein LOC125476927 [Pyrus x bretschneideri]|uniref:uncharacterized protein LOC125476927 n=1 Tax=Pyrus x bretschneideri TaxID=225117 RepID=UPI00202FCC5B|nr:uncharacterized protein LOC125476927 [Pyrus x bretschneideri]